MRIIGGSLRRKALHVPKGRLTRPTTDRTRESIFNLLQTRLDLDGVHVLDLFAGTGALGLEAISRGADAVTFVEETPAVLKYARRNAEDLGVSEACVFLRADAVLYLKRYGGPPFDLILADPPYEMEDIPAMPDLVLPHLTEDGIFVLEHDVRFMFDDHPALDTTRGYGRTVVSLFRHASQPED